MRRSLCCAAVLLFATPAMADIEHIVVTGTRTPGPALQQPVATQVISRAEIARLQATSMLPVLRQIAGLDVFTSGALGGPLSTFMQGGASGQVLILLDGQPLTSPTLGIATLEALHPDDIEYIEIVRGPRASLYGSGSLAGVIQIFTRQAQRTEHRLRIRHGAFNTREAAGSFGYRDAEWTHQLNIARRLTHGYDTTTETEFGAGDDDGASLTNATWSSSWRPRRDVTLQGRYNYMTNHQSYDAGCFDVFEFHQVRCEPNTRTKQQNTSLSGRWEVNPGLVQQVRYSALRQQITTGDHLPQPRPWLGLGDTIDARVNQWSWQQDMRLSGGRHWLSVGADWQQEQVEGSTFDEALPDRNTRSVFAQYQWQYPGWQASTGGRLEHASEFGTVLTAHGDISWQAFEDWQFGVGYSTGFKAPSFNDLYWPNGGNPDLDPERSVSVRTFARFVTQTGYWEGEAFATEYDDLIQWAPTEDPFLWRPQNINQARTMGTTFRWVHDWQQWRIRAHTSFVRARDTETNRQLIARAVRSGQVTVSHGFRDGVLSADIYGSGGRWGSTEETYRTAGFWLLNLRWEQALIHKWILGISIDNFFGAEHQYRPGFPEPGRVFRLSISHHFW
ncbi:MAG: TonB-dependent receptor [Idiomarina sp.]|nr:TonB-dependent receptor [Idiomarina sp.]